MRFLSIFIALLFSTSTLKAEESYLLEPEWVFTFSRPIHSAMLPLLPRDKPVKAYFKRFGITKKLPNGKGFFIGNIERPSSILEAPTLTYILDTPSIGRGKAIARFFSLGTLMSCKRELDVYDSNDQPIGYIEGEYFTDQAAKYICYGADGEVKAIATLDPSWKNLTIVDAQDEEHVIATAEKIFFITLIDDIHYYWKVTVDDDEEKLDPRLLWPVITLVADYYWSP